MDDNVTLFIKGQLREVEAALSDSRRRYRIAKRLGMVEVSNGIGREISGLRTMASVLAVSLVFNV